MPQRGKLILHRTQEGGVRVEVLHEAETFWLNQKKIAELVGVDLRRESYHLNQQSGLLGRNTNIHSTGDHEPRTQRRVRRARQT